MHESCMTPGPGQGADRGEKTNLSGRVLDVEHSRGSRKLLLSVNPQRQRLNAAHPDALGGWCHRSLFERRNFCRLFAQTAATWFDLLLI
jgi:hypothetical protein